VTLNLSLDTEADVCPMCEAHLGHPRGATRRQIVFCATPGVFRWRCPECRGVWQVDHRAKAGAGR
jgi:transposase-like protein